MKHNYDNNAAEIMKRNVISHNDDFTYPMANQILWNKNTVKSKDFNAFLQDEELRRRVSSNKELVIRNFDEADTVDYVFVMVQDLCNVQNIKKGAYDYLQTIGLVEYESNEYKLYSLGRNNKGTIKLHFNNNLGKNVPFSNMYARIYGIGRFDESPVKVAPLQPNNQKHKTNLQIQVNLLLNLDTLEQAQHLEEILYKINYDVS